AAPHQSVSVEMGRSSDSPSQAPHTVLDVAAGDIPSLQLQPSSLKYTDDADAKKSRRVDSVGRSWRWPCLPAGSLLLRSQRRLTRALAAVGAALSMLLLLARLLLQRHGESVFSERQSDVFVPGGMDNGGAAAVAFWPDTSADEDQSPPTPRDFLDEALRRWPPAELAVGRCELHHNAAFLTEPLARACDAFTDLTPAPTAYFDRLRLRIGKDLNAGVPSFPQPSPHGSAPPPGSIEDAADSAALALTVLHSGEQSSPPALIRAGTSRIDCLTLDSALPERLCRTRNVALDLSSTHASDEGRLLPGSLTASCALDNRWWFGGRMTGYGAARVLQNALVPTDDYNPGADVECDAHVDAPVYFVDRWDTTNPFQAHHDLLQAFKAYAALRIDPRTVQPVFLDPAPPGGRPDGPLAALWARAFAADRPLLDLASLPAERGGLVRPRPLAAPSDGAGGGGANRTVCLREAVWSVHGGISPLSRGASFPTTCKYSALLLAFRSFIVDSVRRATLGPHTATRARMLVDWGAGADAADVPLPVPDEVAVHTEKGAVAAARALSDHRLAAARAAAAAGTSAESSRLERAAASAATTSAADRRSTIVITFAARGHPGSARAAPGPL
ncbi:hypothetical protein HK405_011541, partial [Cladochytrium tenue]